MLTSQTLKLLNIPPHSKSPIETVPPAVKIEFIDKFLDMNGLCNLSSASTFFNKNISKNKHWLYWKEVVYWKKKLIEIECPKILLTILSQFAIIKKFESLYDTLICASHCLKYMCTAWDLYILSGEEDAINYAIETYSLDPTDTNQWGENILHLAVFSGKRAAVDNILKKFPKIDLTATTNNGSNLLHLAAWRGTEEIVKYVRYLFYINNIDITGYTVNNKNTNAFAFSLKERKEEVEIYLKENISNIITYIEKIKPYSKKRKHTLTYGDHSTQKLTK